MVKHEKDQATTEAKSVSISPLQPRWLRPAAAAEYGGLSRSSLYELLGSGQVRSYRVKGCRLIDREELDRYIASHLEQGEGNDKLGIPQLSAPPKGGTIGNRANVLPCT